MSDDLKRTPVSAPLACYGLEYVPTDPTCINCPHQQGCRYYHGTRAGRIPLSRAEFHLLPKSFNLPAADAPFDDPEIPQLERVYKDCFISVFNRVSPSSDRVARFAEAIVDAARRANCSIRLYMLSNMVGHRAQQERFLSVNDRQSPTRFSAKMLVGKIAENRVKTYADLCRKDFGTFTPSSLSVLANHDVEKNSLSQQMMNSEVEAGYFIVDWKISSGGPVEEPLYREKELALHPVWLATEDTYKSKVIQPYLEKRCGTQAIQNHRFSVIQTMTEFKKNKGVAVLAFKTREDVMRKATQEVLRMFGHTTEDFEIADEPVTSSVEYWRMLGLAIQHYNCLRYYRGEPSILNI